MTTNKFRLITSLLVGITWAAMTPVNSNASDSKRNVKKTFETYTVSYVSIENEEYYDLRRAYTGATVKQNTRPLNGVKLGIKSAKIIARSIGVQFKLLEHSLKENNSDEIVDLLVQNQSDAAILDIPKSTMLAVAKALAGKPILLFNSRHTDSELRGKDCHSQLFHTIPSDTMLMDALNQYLKSRNWNKVLVLAGPLKADSQLKNAYLRSANKFGVKIVADKPFELSNDPRDRSKTNISLLTGRPRHDVIFIADSLGEFSRYVPYQTYHSRLVAGSEGLIPDTWHWSWERYGAPQLNQRFKKMFNSQMTTTEWAGWVAVKALTSAARAVESVEYSKLLSAISSQDLVLDLYKGSPGNFRSWNNQLRQPILLRTHNAVIGRAPLENYLHHSNTLDTLGVDELESECVW